MVKFKTFHLPPFTMMTKKPYPNSLRAFTLLEISIVMVLIGFIAAGALVTFTASAQSLQYNATIAKMQALDTALLNYRIAYNRLPCPSELTLSPASTDYGLEANADPSSVPKVGNGFCQGGVPYANFQSWSISGTFGNVAEGGIPARALNLPDSYMYDAWGNHFRYAVDVSMTATNAFTNWPVYPSYCSHGNISIYDSTGITGSTNTNLANRSKTAVYVIFSAGQNGHGAYTQNGTILNAQSTNYNEQINCHCNNAGINTNGSGNLAYTPTGVSPNIVTPTYVQMAPTRDYTTLSNNFDDIVSFKERWQLQNGVETAQACPYLYGIENSPPFLDIVNLNPNALTVTQMNPSANANLYTGVMAFQSGNAYVAGTNSSSAGIIDVYNLTTSTLATTITLGTNELPMGIIAYGGYVYVINNNVSGKVYVINPLTNSISTTIPVGTNPQAMTLINGTLYVLNANGGSLSVINPLTQATTTVTGVGYVNKFANGASANIYATVATAYNNFSASVINTAANNAISNITIPGCGSSYNTYNASMAYLNGYLYVPCSTGTTVDIVNTTAGNTVTPLTVGTSPQQIYAAGKYVYVYYNNSNIAMIDSTTNTLFQTPSFAVLNNNARIGTFPGTIAAQGNYVYVPGGNALGVINVPAGTITSYSLPVSNLNELFVAR